jgi:non-ribosomal peptide synthetase component E (peptide arylation enzyme)
MIGINLGCEGLRDIFHPNSTFLHLVHLQTFYFSSNDFSSSDYQKIYLEGRAGEIIERKGECLVMSKMEKGNVRMEYTFKAWLMPIT